MVYPLLTVCPLPLALLCCGVPQARLGRPLPICLRLQIRPPTKEKAHTQTTHAPCSQAASHLCPAPLLSPPLPQSCSSRPLHRQLFSLPSDRTTQRRSGTPAPLWCPALYVIVD